MAVNPFLRGIIRKKIDAKSFKGGMRERKELSDSAGVKGFSKWKMDRILKEAGYDMKKRGNIMGQVLKKNSEKFKEKIKERNIAESRRTAVDGKTIYATGQVSYGGGKVVETRSRVGVEKTGIGKASGGFGLAGSSSSNQGMVNPATPSIGGLGSKRFL